MKIVLSLAAAITLTTTAAAADHACAADAKARAAGLLRLHFESDGLVLAPQAGEPLPGDDGAMMNWSIGDDVTVLPPAKALKGSGALDVLEVWGFIYRAEYRMRFLYAQIPDTCALMGQEILENSDPY